MNDYEFWNELGKIFNAVVAYQEKAIEFNKRFINPWIRLGNVFDKQDRNQEAICAYEKALELDPANAQNWYELGNLHFRAKDYDKAVEAYNKAIGFAPESGWSYNNLALTLVSQGKYVEALPLYQKGVDLIEDDKDKAIVWNRIGNVYRKLNEYDLAVQSFQRADGLDAENAGFRDELDDVPESTAPLQSVVCQDQEQASAENPSPIQLILSESRAEENATFEGADTPANAVALQEADTPPDTVALPEATTTELLSSEDTPQNGEQAALESAITHNENTDDKNDLEIVGQSDTETTENNLPVEQSVQELTGAQQTTSTIIQETIETYTEIPETMTVTTTETSEVTVTTEKVDDGTAAPPEEILSVNVAQTSNIESVQASTLSVEETETEKSEENDVDLVAAEPEENGSVNESAAAETEVEVETVQASTLSVEETDVEPSEEDSDLIAAEPEANETVNESAVAEAEVEIKNETESDNSYAAGQSAYEVFLKDNDDLAVKSDSESEDPMPEALQEPATFVDSSGELQIEMDTKNAHVWNELGNIYFNTGAYDDAIVAYSKAIQLDRWFAWPYSNLALTYVQKGQFTEAILLYQRSIELFASEKDKAISWNRLGNVYRRLNNYESAISAYQRADELDPENTTLSLQSRFSLLGNYSVEQQSSYVSG